MFETIVKHVDPYPNKDDLPLQMQVSSLAYDSYVGRLGIGRVFQGSLKKGKQLQLLNLVERSSVNKCVTSIPMMA